MNSKRILERFRSRQAELETLIAVREQARIWAEAVSSRHLKYGEHFTGRPHGIPEDRTGDGAASLDEIEQLLNQKLMGISEELALALGLIEMADDSTDRAILDEHYILGNTWEVTALHVNISYSHVRQRAKDALIEIDKKSGTFQHP